MEVAAPVLKYLSLKALFKKGFNKLINSFSVSGVNPTVSKSLVQDQNLLPAANFMPVNS